MRRVEMNPPLEWRQPAGITERLFTAGCRMLSPKETSPAKSAEAIEFEKVAKFALSFSETLQQTKDFKPILKRYFAPDYLGGYLQDQGTNWFMNLDRVTAWHSTPPELERFYVAALNANYLACLYFISRGVTGVTPDPKSIPDDIVEFIDRHPYTAVYGRQTNYNNSGDQIDSVERMRSYTDMLEGMSALLRKHVIRHRSDQSKPYRDTLENWDWTFQLYRPRVRTCAQECLGLPKGTRLFEINVPVFHLQIAEINNELRIVSAIDYFR